MLVSGDSRLSIVGIRHRTTNWSQRKESDRKKETKQERVYCLLVLLSCVKLCIELVT